MNYWFLLLICFLRSVPCGWGAEKSAPGGYFVYIGAYTGRGSKGIYAYRFRPSTGRLTSLGLAAELANPAFLAAHPNGRFLYAVSEIDDYEGRASGSVSAFAIDRRSGRLRLLNTVSSRGASPCHLTVDPTGKALLVANYGGGSVAVLPVLEDGRLGEVSALARRLGSSVNPKRQEGPHPHSVYPSPDGRFALAADLGLDAVLVYRFNAAKRSLAAEDPAMAKVRPGAGPRHLAFHPGGRFVYAINELQSTVTAFSYEAKRGALREAQTVSTLPKDFAGNSSAAEIQAHPAGGFLYASNRGHDSIAVFAIDAKNGVLALIEHVPTQGKTPRGFEIDPTGAYLFAANQNSDSVVVFRVDSKTGRLAPAGRTIAITAPVCVKFVASR